MATVRAKISVKVLVISRSGWTVAIIASCLAAPRRSQRIIRSIELARRHDVCASSVSRLEPDCLDRFHDDVEAVVGDVLRNAPMPIANLEDWLVTQFNAATAIGAIRPPFQLAYLAVPAHRRFR